MSPCNLAEVWIWTTKLGLFGFRPVQKPDPQRLGGANLDPYPSTCGFCQVGLKASVPIIGLCNLVVPFMITLRYCTVNRNIVTLVSHCSFWMLWPPVYSRKRDTRSVANAENWSQQSVKDLSACIMGNLSCDLLQMFINEV